MKANFSIKRTSLLIKRYFVENLYREIMFWSIITLVFTMFDQRDFVKVILYISGLVFSVNLYKEFWNAPTGIHFFMLPATHFEKITVAILLNTLYYFAMTLLAYFLGHMLIILVYHLILKIPIPINWDLFEATKTIFMNGKTYVSIENEFWTILNNFALIQALSMAGSLYFKNNFITRTILSVFGVAIIFGIIQLLLMKIFLGDISLADSIVYINIALNNPNIPTVLEYLVRIIGYLIIPFLWIVSYFRLTEKQV
ncbi:MAG: hypothetical protein WCG93_02275 [Paludibacter sp.]